MGAGASWDYPMIEDIAEAILRLTELANLDDCGSDLISPADALAVHDLLAHVEAQAQEIARLTRERDWYQRGFEAQSRGLAARAEEMDAIKAALKLLLAG